MRRRPFREVGDAKWFNAQAMVGKAGLDFISDGAGYLLGGTEEMPTTAVAIEAIIEDEAAGDGADGDHLGCRASQAVAGTLKTLKSRKSGSVSFNAFVR